MIQNLFPARFLIRQGATVRICMRKAFDGSFLCVWAEYAVRFLRFLILALLWRALAQAGADLGGMTLDALLTYTLMASALRQQFEIVSPATSALWEGSIVGRYLRPVGVIASLVAETIGRWWIPVFLFYSLPLLLLAPFFGISPLPASAGSFFLFLPSLALSVIVGFSLDLMFAALAIRLKNGCWAAMMVREALSSLLSGAVIPFALFPGALGRFLALTPFGAIASAPLSIYLGAENALQLLALQLFWAAALALCARRIFRRSEERMVSYGG